MDQRLREASASVRGARRQAEFTVQAPGRSQLLQGSRIALGAVAGVLLIVGLPLVVLGAMSDPGADATAPRTAVTAVASTDESAEVVTGALDLSRLEPISLPPAGDVEGFIVAAANDVIYASATIPNPDEWEVRVWRSVDGGQTWEEALALENEGLDVDMIATGDEVVLLMSNHVGEAGASIYRSTDDGESWQQTDLAAPDGAVGIDVSNLAHGEETVIFGTAWNGVETDTYDGGRVGHTRLVEPRGVTWTLGDGVVSEPFEQSNLGHVDQAVTIDGHYVAIGEAFDGEHRPAVWSSYDGVHWTVVNLPAASDGYVVCNYLDTLTSTHGSVLITAEACRGDVESGGVGTVLYVSDNGKDWTVRVDESFILGGVVGSSVGFVARAHPLNADAPVGIAMSEEGLTWSFEAVGMFLQGGVSTDQVMYLFGVDGIDGAYERGTLRRLELP